MNTAFWHNKRVLLTGHTGFKGGWLALWLQQMGAEVSGFSLQPSTNPNLFALCRVAEGMANSFIGDIRDAHALNSALKMAKPEIVFHLAAQPLVRHSYLKPIETYAINVMGTVNLLEIARATPSVRAIVIITSDKCYENQEWVWPYRENEPLGGHDPYSSSKACVELVASAYRRSFLNAADIALATARAGNVIGGGDWSTDRLLPDFLRAFTQGETLEIRSPNAIRPWQHALEPLRGYLLLAEKLYKHGKTYAEPWNFGPSDADARSVRWVVERLSSVTPGAKWIYREKEQPHEAGYLKLDSSKARNRLGWTPHWSLDVALAKTVEWHKAWCREDEMRAVTFAQIAEYETAGAEA